MKDKKVLQNELKYEDLDHVDKGIVDKVLKGGYSRRDALKIMVATGITMAAAENILISGNVAMAATPKKGGTIRMASDLHGPSDQTDPPQFTSGIDYSRGRAVYNSLIQHANDLTPQPELFQAWQKGFDPLLSQNILVFDI